MSRIKMELRQRYLGRAALFWKYVKDANFAALQHVARKAAWKSLEWHWDLLGITEDAREAAQSFGLVPTEVFAHPDIIAATPELLEYYRLLACLPKKGLAQIRVTSKSRTKSEVCILLNEFISHLLSTSSKITRDLVLRTIFAEAGSEWQGTWVNNVGQVAARQLEQIIVGYASKHGLLDEAASGELAALENCIVLKSGARIRFASEPDVECRDANNMLRCVIEVKGSADKAGAQTRLGETKKSFAKAKLESAHCVTIFLPSVITSAVAKQLKTERDIDKTYNLLDIFRDSSVQEDFLKELFQFVLREQK